jgi:hypothetical protein
MSAVSHIRCLCFMYAACPAVALSEGGCHTFSARYFLLNPYLYIISNFTEIVKNANKKAIFWLRNKDL